MILFNRHFLRYRYIYSPSPSESRPTRPIPTLIINTPNQPLKDNSSCSARAPITVPNMTEPPMIIGIDCIAWTPRLLTKNEVISAVRQWNNWTGVSSRPVGKQPAEYFFEWMFLILRTCANSHPSQNGPVNTVSIVNNHLGSTLSINQICQETATQHCSYHLQNDTS